MDCPNCKRRLALAKSVRMWSGKVIRILECRECGHLHLDALEATA